MSPPIGETGAPLEEEDNGAEAKIPKSEPPPVVAFRKLYKEVLEGSHRMRSNTEQLFDHIDLLFSDMDEPEVDPPTFFYDQEPVECARLVGKIYDLDQERRDLDKKSDLMTQRVFDLLSQLKALKRMDDAEFAGLVSQFVKTNERVKEENLKLNHFMEAIFAHCSSHLALIFGMLLEE